MSIMSHLTTYLILISTLIVVILWTILYFNYRKKHLNELIYLKFKRPGNKIYTYACGVAITLVGWLLLISGVSLSSLLDNDYFSRVTVVGSVFISVGLALGFNFETSLSNERSIKRIQTELQDKDKHKDKHEYPALEKQGLKSIETYVINSKTDIDRENYENARLYLEKAQTIINNELDKT